MDPAQLFGQHLDGAGPAKNLAAFDTQTLDDKGRALLKDWAKWLRNFDVYFCWPLDLDFSMLRAFPDAYRKLEDGMKGPSQQGDAKAAVLGEEGTPEPYVSQDDADFRWYRYLFLGRGKPSTHVRVLGGLAPGILKAGVPEELKVLLDLVAAGVKTTQASEAKC